MPKAAQPSQATAGGDAPPPMAGALLRMTYQGIRERQYAAVIGKGFDDLNQPLLTCSSSRLRTGCAPVNSPNEPT